MRRVLLVVIGVLVATAGLYLGSMTRSLFPRPGETVMPPGSKLAAGMIFPDVPLLGENGEMHSASDLLGTDGAVVLFLALGCAPCKTMSKIWGDHAASGQLGALRLFGVASASPEMIRLYKENNRITFPIFADSAAVFMKTWGVDEYPLRLEIDHSRVIRGQTYDPDEEPDPRELARRLGR